MENRAENYTILVLFQVESTKERIDLEQLKVRDRPLFFWRGGGMKNIEKKLFAGPKKTK